MLKFHEVEIAGLKRQLPLYQIEEDVFIPLFIAHNDIALIQSAAKALLDRVVDFDVIVTEEIQGISLAYAMSLLAGKERFIVARKNAKAYMDDVVAIQILQKDDEEYKRLYVSKEEADYISNKRVLLVDDVILYGQTMDSLFELTNALGGYVVGEASIIHHGFEYHSSDIPINSLVTLPLFNADGSVYQKEENK